MARPKAEGVPLRFNPKDGNCAKPNTQLDIFFPEGKPAEIIAKTTQAKQMCATCPIVDLCLLSALDNDEWGIWGGSTKTERKALRKSRSSIDLHLKNLKTGNYRVSGKDENTIIKD